MDLNNLYEIVSKEFENDCIAVVGFGSFFTKDENQKGDSDIDLAVLLKGSLNIYSYNKIKSINNDLKTNNFSDKYKHIPFYIFSEEHTIINSSLKGLIRKGIHKIIDQNGYTDITIPRISMSSELITLAKEHTYFARACLLDDMLFSEELGEKIFKNHTTIALRMILQQKTGSIFSGGYDVWKKWTQEHTNLKIGENYEHYVNMMKDINFKLIVQQSIISDINNYEKS